MSGDGEGWLAVDGTLDGTAGQRLREQLAILLRQGCRRLTVDLRETRVIEPPGLRVLVEALRTVEGVGGSLVLRAPPDDVYALGRVRRLGELLSTVDDAVDEAEAIRRLDRLIS
ncbi:MAG TPA: STAS domain-containing protein [Acidimicrobiales bacterium]|nr:STAS domain-containing protein [Acidimicrobiales bacterium]